MSSTRHTHFGVTMSKVKVTVTTKKIAQAFIYLKLHRQPSVGTRYAVLLLYKGLFCINVINVLAAAYYYDAFIWFSTKSELCRRILMHSRYSVKLKYLDITFNDT
jgi:hypothetical protein